MITTKVEYERAEAELRDLTDRLARPQRDHSNGDKGVT
jgi:hypothetical protein